MLISSVVLLHVSIYTDIEYIVTVRMYIISVVHKLIASILVLSPQLQDVIWDLLLI